ncbi:hypothetical protein EC968_008798, partial [Mortierella alpina]
MTIKSKPAAPGHDENDDDTSISSQHMRKRDKFLSMFRSNKPDAHATTLMARPKAKAHDTNSVSIKAGEYYSSDNSSVAVSSSELTQSTIEGTKVRLDAFSTNAAKPAVRVVVPKFGARIDNTPQLALCSRLLPKNPALHSHDEPSLQINRLQIKEATLDPLVDEASSDWVKAIEQSPIEQSHVRWLLERMVE